MRNVQVSEAQTVEPHSSPHATKAIRIRIDDSLLSSAPCTCKYLRLYRNRTQSQSLQLLTHLPPRINTHSYTRSYTPDYPSGQRPSTPHRSWLRLTSRHPRR